MQCSAVHNCYLFNFTLDNNSQFVILNLFLPNFLALSDLRLLLVFSFFWCVYFDKKAISGDYQILIRFHCQIGNCAKFCAFLLVIWEQFRFAKKRQSIWTASRRQGPIKYFRTGGNKIQRQWKWQVVLDLLTKTVTKDCRNWN